MYGKNKVTTTEIMEEKGRIKKNNFNRICTQKISDKAKAKPPPPAFPHIKPEPSAWTLGVFACH